VRPAGRYAGPIHVRGQSIEVSSGMSATLGDKTTVSIAAGDLPEVAVRVAEIP
jgi:hypothetical protein